MAQGVNPWDLYSRRDRAAFLCVLFLVGTSNYVDRNVIGVLLEPIKNEFQVSDTLLGLLSGLSFALFYATLGIPVARWADRGDRKLVMTLSLAVWSVMTALCGAATTFWQLLIARFGVGAGEAGALPPAQSLLADYYPPERRARAIGIFVMSGSSGYVLGLMLGGVLVQQYGWRATLIIFGLSGLLLLPFTHYVLKEPRHLPQFKPAADTAESMVEAFRILMAKPAYFNLIAGMVVYFLTSYGALVFIISLMIRAYGLTTAQAGTIFGGVFAAAALVGSLAGGALADRLAARDVTWLPRLAGWGLIAAFPLYELALMSPGVVALSVLVFLATTALAGSIPASFSAIHLVCGSKRRAFAIALTFFFANLVGLGLGPLVTGMLSDAFAATHGSAEGLRFALMACTGALLPAGWLMLRAVRTFRADAEA
jgi:MFS family permease